MRRMAFILIPLLAMIPILLTGCDSGEPAIAAAPPGPSLPVEPAPTAPIDSDQGPVPTVSPINILPQPTISPTTTPTPTTIENGGAAPLAYDMFMRIEGIPGESTDAQHKDWIEILSYDQKITGTLPPDPLRSGHPEFGEFTITKAIDKASPKLAEAVCKGTHIPAVTLELCRGTGETKEVYMRYRLRDVVIMKVYDKSSPQIYKALDKSSPILFMSMPETIEAYDKASPILFAASPEPMEEVSFVYSKIDWTYFVGGDGPGAEVSAGWDIVKNQPQ